MRLLVAFAVVFGASVACAAPFETAGTARSLKSFESRNVPGRASPPPNVPTIPGRPVSNTPIVPGRPGGPGSIPPISPPPAPIPEEYKAFTGKPAPNGGLTRREWAEGLYRRDTLEARVVLNKPSGPAVERPTQPISRPSTPASETVHEPSVNRPPYSITGRGPAESLMLRELLDEIYSLR